jgi:hypothetical protein
LDISGYKVNVALREERCGTRTEARLPLVHFIGKDNIVFSLHYFPAMLKAEEAVCNVPANEFWNLVNNLSTCTRFVVLNICRFSRVIRCFAPLTPYV